MGIKGAKATVYVDTELHRALKIKASETNQSISELVNRAVRLSLSEDLEDLEAMEERASEASRPFEQFLKELRRDGEI